MTPEESKQFDERFTQSFRGDSGLGGNTPQEPEYRIAVDDPNEIKSFISSLLSARQERLLGVIAKESMNFRGYKRSSDEAFLIGSVLSDLAERIKKGV